MPLIVEDGTCPPDANSYVSVADADAYAVLRGLSDWPAFVPDTDMDADPNLLRKEAALVRATDYLNTLVWQGVKVDWQRVMAWPRTGIVIALPDTEIPADIVPDAVRRACIEAAVLLYAGEDLLASQERGGRIQQETIGPITTVYFDDSVGETLYPAISGLVSAFLAQIPGKPTTRSGCVDTMRS